MSLPNLLTANGLPRLTCRPALPMDKTGVLELVANIWDGHDYIPYVWDDWMADPAGQMVVAEYLGKIVGLCRLTWLTDGEWWLEGLRVHPEFGGRGFGAHLFEHCLRLWEQQAGRIVRLMTSHKNVVVHHLCDRLGFHKIGGLAFVGAPVLDEPVNSLEPLSAEDVSAALELLQQNPPLAYGLVDYCWKFGAPSADLLMHSAADGHAWWWRGRTGLATIWEDDDDGEKYPLLQTISCPADALSDYLLDYRRLMARLGYPKGHWMAPLRPEMEPTLAAAGFSVDPDEIVYCYEKRSPVYGIIPPAEKA